MKNIIIDFKLLEKNNLDFKDFISLYKIYIDKLYSNNDMYIDDETISYYELEKKKYIKIKRNIDELTITIILRQKAIDLLKDCETNQTVKTLKNKIKINKTNRELDIIIEENIEEYRNKWKGLKPGSMGDLKSIKEKLKRWLSQNPDKTIEDVLKAANIYIQSLNEEYNYLQQADYFIFKKNGKEESSRLSSFIDEININIEKDWTSKLN